MGLLSQLRSKKKTRGEGYADGYFFRIPSRAYFGWFATSPDGRYTITWRDANGDGTHGGARVSGMGCYYLLDGAAIIAEGQVERPNDGKVANDGTFILNDWRFSADLSGAFFAFRADGSPIIAKSFTANLYNNGLSANGSLAVCQICNSPTEDASVLAVFDLIKGAEIARWIPESGWAQSYEFPEDGLTVRLCYPGGASFAYSLQGAFVDRDHWIQWSLSEGNLVVIERLLDEAGKTPSAALAGRLIEGIDVALAACHPGDGHARSWAFKLRGICLEAVGNALEALRFYEEALRLDPKIGIKRRADALRKALSK